MVENLTSDAAILKQIEEFCEIHGMGATTFGRKAIGDANLVANLKTDRSLTLKTANRIADFMVGYSSAPESAAA